MTTIFFFILLNALAEHVRKQGKYSRSESKSTEALESYWVVGLWNGGGGKKWVEEVSILFCSGF